jgi:hypothetical protein
VSLTIAVAFVDLVVSDSPNTKTGSAAYYRSMIASFASFAWWNPDADLVLVGVSRPPEPFATQLADLGVSVYFSHFSHSPPDGFTDRFTTSLFKLDALQALRDRRRLLLVDPGVICLRPVGRLVGEVAGKVGVLRMRYPPDRRVNGLSRNDARLLYADMGEPQDLPPPHYGGDCYAVGGDIIDALLQRAEATWSRSIERWATGEELYFVTEEHMLSYAVAALPTLSSRRTLLASGPPASTGCSRRTSCSLRCGIARREGPRHPRMYRLAIDRQITLLVVPGARVPDRRRAPPTHRQMGR